MLEEIEMPRHELINTGTKTDQIPVELSYQIIKHFSAGLYTSPNKAIEELVANSYDAWANHVYIIMPDNLASSEAIIWVIDDGESMDVNGFKELWLIGESNKRSTDRKSHQRPPIGKFGIGKLATYVLARELTYVCKKKGKYRVVSMDFAKLEDNPKRQRHQLNVRELTKKEAKFILNPILKERKSNSVASKLFGSDSAKTWTVAAMSNLSDMARKLSDGRLKRVLRTALPISPQFNLFYGEERLRPVRVDKPTIKEWTIGKEDKTADKLDFEAKIYRSKEVVLIPNLGPVWGKCQLFEEPPTTGKSKDWGRSHGFFVMVRNRLINLHDELFGLEAQSHGAFSRFRMVVHADGLDEYLRATRESVSGDEDGVKNFRNYIRAKFNEARAKYNTWATEIEFTTSISRRISKTPQSLSRRPLVHAIRMVLDGKVKNLFLSRVPINLRKQEKESLLIELEKHIENDDFFTDVSFEPLGVEHGLAIFDAEERHFKINILHPFFANYCEHSRSHEAFQLLAITEVLTEAYLLEANIAPQQVETILRRRDRFLRELVFSTQLAAPIVAQLLKDSKADSTGLEDAVYEGLRSLGFETTKIGGKGKPDGIALAWLGVRDDSGDRADYNITYDAKSSSKLRISANKALPPAIVRHRDKYESIFSLVVAPGFDGQEQEDCAIAIDARREKVTIITVDDFMRLVLIASTRPVGFPKLREFFETCYAPVETNKWVDDLESKDVPQGPIKEILEVTFELQKESPDPVKFAAVRLRLAEKCPRWATMREREVQDWCRSVRRIAGPLITITNDVVSLEQPPERIIQEIGLQTSKLPEALRNSSAYYNLMKDSKKKKTTKKKLKKKIVKRR